jgi:hypothetical protein
MSDAAFCANQHSFADTSCVNLSGDTTRMTKAAGIARWSSAWSHLNNAFGKFGGALDGVFKLDLAGTQFVVKAVETAGAALEVVKSLYNVVCEAGMAFFEVAAAVNDVYYAMCGEDEDTALMGTDVEDIDVV